MTRKYNIPLPPADKQPPQVNVAEFLALRTIVQEMLATMAAQEDSQVPGAALPWLSHIRDRCCGVVDYASITGIGFSPAEIEILRASTLRHIENFFSPFPGKWE
jgi:hypothetical protein